MEVISFRCCKSLDHTKGRYTDCELKKCDEGYVYWERGETWTDNGRNPRDVQFCKMRGRLNNKCACIEGFGDICSQYEGEERTVELD